MSFALQGLQPNDSLLLQRGANAAPVGVGALGAYPAIVALSGATPNLALNGRANVMARITLTANTTLSITGAVAGQRGTLLISQDATGSRTLTLPAGSIQSGTLTATASAECRATYEYDGTNYWWTFTGPYA